MQSPRFSQSGLPSGATATFSPSTVAAGSAPTSVTLSISLPATATAQPLNRPFRGGTLPDALGLILFPIVWRLRGLSRTLRSFVALFVLGVVALTATTGWGGGGGGGTSSRPPPQSRTYSLTVTATSGSLVQSTTLTLKVGCANPSTIAVSS